MGLRVPISGPRARRVENRIAGADANPYLAIAASLACGYLGMIDELEPTEPIKGSAYRLAQTLPQQMPEPLASCSRAARSRRSWASSSSRCCWRSRRPSTTPTSA